MLQGTGCCIVSTGCTKFRAGFSNGPRSLPQGVHLCDGRSHGTTVARPLLLFSLGPNFPTKLSLFPHPSVTISRFAGAQIRVTILSGSPYRVTIFKPRGNSLAQKVTSFNCFGPCYNTPTRTSERNVTVNTIYLTHPPSHANKGPHQNQRHAPRPLQRTSVPSLVGVNIFSTLCFTLITSLVTGTNGCSDGVNVLVDCIIFTGVSASAS